MHDIEYYNSENDMSIYIRMPGGEWDGMVPPLYIDLWDSVLKQGRRFKYRGSVN